MLLPAPSGAGFPFWGSFMQTDMAVGSHEEQPLISNRVLYRVTAAIAGMAALTFAISVTARTYGGQLAIGGHTDSTQEYAITIGSDTLSLPANTIRFSEQRTNGPSEQTNLYFAWPEMTGYSPALQRKFDDVGNAGSLIFVQLSEATMSRDMSGRLEPIYNRLFEGKPETGPYGLTLNRLKPDSGYGDEVIFTAPRAGTTNYVVRCIIPKNTDANGSGDCQRDIHLGSGLSVLYRFSYANLRDWNQIDGAVSRFVTSHLVSATSAGG